MSDFQPKCKEFLRAVIELIILEISYMDGDISEDIRLHRTMKWKVDDIFKDCRDMYQMYQDIDFKSSNETKFFRIFMSYAEDMLSYLPRSIGINNIGIDIIFRLIDDNMRPIIGEHTPVDVDHLISILMLEDDDKTSGITHTDPEASNIINVLKDSMEVKTRDSFEEIQASLTLKISNSDLFYDRCRRHSFIGDYYIIKVGFLGTLLK